MVDDNNTGKNSAQEKQYNASKNLFESMSCMTITEEKVKLYKTLAKDFKAIGDYMDAGALSEECDRLAKKTKSQVNDSKLEKAKLLMENGKSSESLHKANKLLKELKDYKNAEELRIQCESSFDRLNKKRRKGLYAFYLVIVCILGLVIYSRTDHCHYQVGKVFMSTGHYGRVAGIFTNLKEYKDSEEFARECNYKAGESILSGDDLTQDSYKNAKNYFLKTAGYKDSNQRIAKIEQQLFAHKKVGDRINIGNHSWIIVDKLEDKALAVKVEGLDGLAFSTELSNVTWENSFIRKYLNSTFLEETFTKEEQAYIVDTALSNTNFGKDTTDKIFILSAKEMKYQDVLNKHKNNSWLRTAGRTTGTVVFMSPNGDVMDYGYAADTTELLTVPAFWYQY